MSKPFVSSTPMKYEKSDASLLTTCTYTEVPCADFDPEAGGISLCIDKNGTACWPARVYRIISQNKDLLLNAYIYIWFDGMHLHKAVGYINTKWPFAQRTVWKKKSTYFENLWTILLSDQCMIIFFQWVKRKDQRTVALSCPQTAAVTGCSAASSRSTLMCPTSTSLTTHTLKL